MWRKNKIKAFKYRSMLNMCLWSSWSFSQPGMRPVESKWCAFQLITIYCFNARTNVQTSNPQSERLISQRWKTTRLASLGTGVANQLSRFSTAMGTRTTPAWASMNRFPFWKLHWDNIRPSQSYKWWWVRGLDADSCSNPFRAFFTQLSAQLLFHHISSSSHTTLSSSYFSHLNAARLCSAQVVYKVLKFFSEFVFRHFVLLQLQLFIFGY